MGQRVTSALKEGSDFSRWRRGSNENFTSRQKDRSHGVAVRHSKTFLCWSAGALLLGPSAFVGTSEFEKRWVVKRYRPWAEL